MDDKQLVDFVNDMMRTDLDCLDCTEVNDVLARYVDLEVAGSTLETVSPEMAEHIKACPPCADMHATLLEVARLEADGSLTDTDALWSDVAQLVDRRASRRAGSSELAGLSMRLLAGVSLAAAAMVVMFFGWRGANEKAEESNGLIIEAQATMEAMQAEIKQLSEGLGEARVSAETANEAAERNRIALDMIDQMDRIQASKQEDGSWARFYFSPDKPIAVVSVGDLSGLPDGDYLECWLKRASDGEVMQVGRMELQAEDGSKAWHWMIEAGTPIEEYSTFMITAGSQDQPLFEVPLTQDS